MSVAKLGFRVRKAWMIPVRVERIGNGQNTVSRVLFQKRELTEF